MSNPFIVPSAREFGLPDFSAIKPAHYREAFEAGMNEQQAEVAEIVAATPITFENTIVALEKSGRILSRVANTFFNINWSHGTPEIQAIDEEFAPRLAAHQDSITLNQALFSRIKELYNRRNDLNISGEELRLLEKYYEEFAHAGAGLAEAVKKRVKEINERLATLETLFGKRLLEDTNLLAVEGADLSELTGLDEGAQAAAQSAASARGAQGSWVIPMVNFTGHPLLSVLESRRLREELMRRSLSRGGNRNENDTSEILLEMVKLRAERATLFGFATHADYVLSRQTAKNPKAVHEMLRSIAPRARRNAEKEANDLEKIIAGAHELASWDWAFYSEKVRKEKYEIDSEALRPYFELERVLRDGVFFAASRLFGITFVERPDLKTYHPEARAFEVRNEDGSLRGLYIADFYARPTKRGGAWMNTLVDQNYLFDEMPVAVNNLNIPKPSAGEPTLLTLDETRTLFHEFGHALHGLLSKVRYPRFSGTSVERDYVEFPSQVNEMWIYWPEVLSNYAKHHETGVALPIEIVERLKSAAIFGEGYRTLSYLAAAVLDLAWHELKHPVEVADVEKFEFEALRNYGLDYEPVPTRYRSTYFSHIFAGGYSAGYYGYIWSEVLDADAVEWFKENGGLTRANGAHFESTLLGQGGSQDSMAMYRSFRGRDAKPEPLLKRRGLQ